MSALVHVKGLAELDKFLKNLPAKIEQNILTGALRAGANVIAEEAKAQLASNGSVQSGFLRSTIRVSVKRRKGRVRARVIAHGDGDKNEPIWVEYGTAAHWITVKQVDRPGRMTRRGYRAFSIRTINRIEARGSLVIGGKFVGPSVRHPGAKKKPFMRPALDGKAQQAVLAAAEYIKKRLAKKHGVDTSHVEIEAL
jgi:HK97 gp10 family phage protein